MILLIDNYDSFVYNLARYFCRLNVDTRVVRNDELSVDDVRQWDVEAIVLSPGPCGPEESGVCVRSSSRVGDSDFGVNKARLAFISAELKRMGWDAKGPSA